MPETTLKNVKQKSAQTTHYYIYGHKNPKKSYLCIRCVALPYSTDYGSRTGKEKSMKEKKLTFALFGNSYQARKSTPALEVITQLRAHGATILVDHDYHEFLTGECGLDIDVDGTFGNACPQADYAVSIGGDGTFLKAATRVGPQQIPLIGINTGRLGFLAGVLPTDIKAAFNDIFSGKYTIEDHTAIEIKADNGAVINDCPYALNDIAVLKRAVASMITIHTTVDDEYLTTYQADGLVISTPTGSTAYSLSNGGPVIVPQTGTLCLTPVAPHSLNIRPIVISDNSTVRLSVSSRSHDYLAAIDGRSVTLTEDITVTIAKAPFTTHIIKRKGQTYFSSLREKMMWGADKREQ